MHADIDPEDLRLAVAEMLPGLLKNRVYGIIADRVMELDNDVASVEDIDIDMDDDHEEMIVRAHVLRTSLAYGSSTVSVWIKPCEILYAILHPR